MAVSSALLHHQMFLFFAHWIVLVLISRPGTELGKNERSTVYYSIGHHSSCSSWATIKVLKLASESIEENWKLHLGLNSILWLINALLGDLVPNSLSSEAWLVSLPRAYIGLSEKAG